MKMIRHRPDMTEPIKLVGVLKDLGVKLVNVTTGVPTSIHILVVRLNAHQSMAMKLLNTTNWC